MKNQNFVYAIALGVMLTAVLAGCGESTTTTTQVKDTTPATTTSTTTTNTVADTSGAVGDVRVYEGAGKYMSPAGSENVDVTISYKDNKITDVNLTSDTTHAMSMRYQGLFLEGLKKQIVGKSLDEVSVSGNVNGSSLTAGGFNEALEKIKAQAKA